MYRAHGLVEVGLWFRVQDLRLRLVRSLVEGERFVGCRVEAF